MGQQQLLLIVLGIIIVGIAVAVGINMFRSSAVDANRNALVSDLAHLASKAQQHFKKPLSMGGGAQTMTGFQLNWLDQHNDNGWYGVVSQAVAAAVDASPGDSASIVAYKAYTGTDTVLYLKGWGTEQGDDGTNEVQASSTVSGTNFVTNVLN